MTHFNRNKTKKEKNEEAEVLLLRLLTIPGTSFRITSHTQPKHSHTHYWKNIHSRWTNEMLSHSTETQLYDPFWPQNELLSNFTEMLSYTQMKMFALKHYWNTLTWITEMLSYKMLKKYSLTYNTETPSYTPVENVPSWNNPPYTTETLTSRMVMLSHFLLFTHPHYWSALIHTTENLLTHAHYCSALIYPLWNVFAAPLLKHSHSLQKCFSHTLLKYSHIQNWNVPTNPEMLAFTWLKCSHTHTHHWNALAHTTETFYTGYWFFFSHHTLQKHSHTRYWEIIYSHSQVHNAFPAGLNTIRSIDLHLRCTVATFWWLLPNI